MKGIDPKWTMYLGLLVTIEQAIGHGTVSLTNLVPADWSPYITSWCNFLAFVGTSIMTYQAAVSSPMPGPAINTPIAPTVVKVLLVAFVLSAFLAGGAQAQTAPKLGPIGTAIKDKIDGGGQPSGILGGQKLTGSAVTDIQNFMNAKFLPDLQYALKLAQASKNNITSDCYQAWIDIITTQQTAVQTKNPDGTTTDLPMPDPHVITEFEKLVELRNALKPESPFMVKCSPVASMIKKDIASFMGIVITGGAGLATLVPGL